MDVDQLTKCELGLRRMPAPVLYEASRAMNLPVSWFFDDLVSATLPSNPEEDRGELVKLVRLVPEIDDPKAKETAIRNYAKILRQSILKRI